MKPTADARFRFSPRGSQIFVVLFGLGSIVSAFVSMYFVTMPQPSIWLLPAFFSSAFGWLSYKCWRESHSSADMPNPTPINITSADGTSVSADARFFSDSGAVQKFIKVLEMVNQRRELPAPSGMVTVSGLPDASRIDEAKAIVLTANNEAKMIATEVVAGMVSVSEKSVAFEQPLGAILDPGNLIRGNVVAELLRDKAPSVEPAGPIKGQ